MNRTTLPSAIVVLLATWMLVAVAADQTAPAKELPSKTLPSKEQLTCSRWCTDRDQCRPFGSTQLCRTYCVDDGRAGNECNVQLGCPAPCNFSLKKDDGSTKKEKGDGGKEADSAKKVDVAK